MWQPDGKRVDAGPQDAVAGGEISDNPELRVSRYARHPAYFATECLDPLEGKFLQGDKVFTKNQSSTNDYGLY